MPLDRNIKKRVVVSFHNLTDELQEAVKKKYPAGFTESMIRIDKPTGDFFYAVVYETEDTSYLVKIDVNIDDKTEDDDDKDFFGDHVKDEGGDEVIDTADENDDD